VKIDGAGATGVTAVRLGREFIGLEVDLMPTVVRVAK
jgi:DNA modification methylase